MPVLPKRKSNASSRYQTEISGPLTQAPAVRGRKLQFAAGLAATVLGAAVLGIGFSQASGTPDVDRVASSADTVSQPVVAEQSPVLPASPAPATSPAASEPAVTPIEAAAPQAPVAPAPASPAPIAPMSAQLASTGTSQPVGVPGNWTMTFADEFNGAGLDAAKWSNCWFSPGCGTMNKVSTSPANVSVANGNLSLGLASATSGGLVSTNPNGGAGTGYQFTTGYVEARIKFTGNANGLTNWPAFWTTGQSWPATGENDIAEVLKAKMTVNYHSSSGTHNQGTVPGNWANEYHTFGLHRMANSSDVYFDGVKVKSYPTDDGNAPQYIVLNVGSSSTNPVYGPQSQMMVDYVRAWQ